MSESEYPIVNNFLFYKEMGTDCIGVDYRAGQINPEERKADKHNLVTEVYPFLAGNPNIWKRINILLEGVKKSNIPKLYSPDKIIHNQDKTYLVYPLLKGKTFEQVLEDSIKVDNPINFDLAFSIAFAIADLIDVGSSIVVSGEKSFHGFLTPDNIFIDYDGKIYLKNYGIYPYLSREETILNEMVKKYGAWIAPEFMRKEKLVCQTDIYHLGYIIYRILTGKYFSYSPDEDFDAKFSNISFSQHIPSSDKDFLTNIITFFKRALNPQPSQRFANIKEFKDYISNKFHIEELSSVTFNLAYFMNSIYLESMEKENKELAKELAYVLPEKKKPAPKPQASGKSSDDMVADILTGLDEHEKKSSMSKLILPLAAVVLILIAVSVYFFISQQNEIKQQALIQDQRAAAEKIEREKKEADQKAALDLKMKLLEDQYQQKLKEIEDKATSTTEEKKAQEEEIKKLKAWQKDEAEKAMTKQKELEDKKIQEAEAEKQRLADLEKKTQEDALAKQKALEAQKKIQTDEANRIKPGQLVALTSVDTKPEKLKGKDPIFSYPIRKKYKGQGWTVRAILLIDESGNVGSVRMQTKLPEDLKNVIIRVIEKWNYKPAEKDKVKVKVWIPIAIKITFE